jgi:hypothetical protein
MKAMWGVMRAELVGAGGVVERNAYLTKRYIWWDVAWFVWTVANTLTIVFIAKGVDVRLKRCPALGGGQFLVRPDLAAARFPTRQEGCPGR